MSVSEEWNGHLPQINGRRGAYGNAEWSQRALSPHVEVSNTQDDVTT